jgi:CheY-like chemotaxis protein
MVTNNLGSKIERVAVVDDDPLGRDTYKLMLEDMETVPVLLDGPLPNLNDFVTQLTTDVNAAFCDYHLKKMGDFATFNGDELASELYSNNIPVVLCTRFTDWEATVFRRFRRNIPRIISYDEAEPDVVMHAFELCQREFRNDFETVRRPWRSLVRFDEYVEDGEYWYVVVPSWNAENRVRLHSDDFPQSVSERIKNGQVRFHAKVNIGAESDEELFFTEWEE